MDPLYPDDDGDSLYEYASDLNFRESVNRQIRWLVRSVPVGCLSDRMYFVGRWLNAIVAHCHHGADLPEGISIDQRDQIGEQLFHICSELGDRGFNVPTLPDWEVDPLGSIVGWRDYLKTISPHVSSADQATMDGLIGSVSVKH